MVSLLFGVSTHVKAQFYSRDFLVDTVKVRNNFTPKKRPRDTLVIQKRFGRAVFELGLAEVVTWSFDKFVKKADYANISFKTVGHNLNPGSWEWDNDEFQTNQFGHPYHGSYFYSAFRSNGYSFWQSVPAVFVGSYIWETAAENQAPAPNDFINTSFGGVILGEMTYRLSNKIVNNRSRGFKRQASEVFGFLVNPMNGLNRLIDGRWGKVYGNSKERDSSKITADFDIGLRQFSSNNRNVVTNGRFGWYGRARLLYGTAYENYKTPFSNITITTEFGKDDSTSLNVVSVYGSLIGWKIQSEGRTKHLAVLSANYDYIRNEAFFYGAQSVKFNLLSDFSIAKKTKLLTSLGAGPIILAAVPDDYILSNGRNYDYGSGVSYNANGRLAIKDKLFLSLNYRGAWTKTINGNQSHYFLHTVSGELSYMFIENVSLNVEPGYFTLRGYYKKYPDVDKNYPYLRASVRYAVNL